MDADFPENYVAQLSGHKNLKSLDAFKLASQIKAISDKCQWCRAGPPAINSGNSEIQGASISKLSVQGQEASSSKAKGFCSRATIGNFEGCTFNFHMPTAALCSEGKTSWPAKRKKHIAIVSDDSDSDWGTY